MPRRRRRAAEAPVNWHAVVMFIIFVAITLVITYWAATRTKTATDFYAAGRGITGFQNGMAIAGDYMSAASFLGIAALVYFNGFYGLIFSVGWLVGWPIILFLIAERLRNLGKFTYADVASFRLQQGPVRTMAAIGSLIVVIWYLIGQAVGAGQLLHTLVPQISYRVSIVIVGALIIIYVTFGGMKATTWVQIIKAGLLLGGATLMAIGVMAHEGWSFDEAVLRRRRSPSQAPGNHEVRGAHRGEGQSDRVDFARPDADVRYRRSAAHPDALLHRRPTPRRRASRCSTAPASSATSTS